MKKPYSILISAVEPSGDRLAGALIREMRKTHDVQARGITGPKMREAGIETLYRMEDISAMGLVEVVRKLPQLRKARKILRQAMDVNLDCILGVDAPDFHLPILSEAKNRNILAIGWHAEQIEICGYDANFMPTCRKQNTSNICVNLLTRKKT